MYEFAFAEAQLENNVKLALNLKSRPAKIEHKIFSVGPRTQVLSV